MLLSGYVRDKNGNALAGADIFVKDDRFQTIYQAVSDGKGFYSVDLPAGKYPFFAAVREYGENYLEYWCQNLDLAQDMQLDIRIDTLEVYGLHVFTVKGGYPSLMAYFRPMSLKKFQNGDPDICPDIQRIRVLVDSREASVLAQSRVCESMGDRDLGAFLIQVALPEKTSRWDRVDVEIWDGSDAYGAATIFAD